MRAAQRSRRSPRGFTLVEMLAVVAIIGILVSMVTAAAYMARVRVRISRIAMEAKQLEAACHAYRERFGEFPPDGTNATALTRHLKRMFPMWDSTAYPAPTAFTSVTPGTALVTFLGGMRDASNRPIGYSPNARNPFEVVTTEGRIGPFFEFQQQRLIDHGSGPVYHPDGAPTTNESGAFVYFRAEQADWDANGTADLYTVSGTTKNWLAHTHVKPVTDGRIASKPWANPQSCQIICGGLDGRIGTGADFPDGTDYTADRWDDQANFVTGTFEDERE